MIQRTRVTATSCNFLHNARAGAEVGVGGTLSLQGCTSRSNSAGYCNVGGVLEIESSERDGDGAGCHVHAGTLTARNVSVTSCTSFGFLVEKGGAALKGCSVTNSLDDGMLFRSAPGTESSVEDCTLAQNQDDGICALEGASVAVRGCRSRDNTHSGYYVGGHARMTVAHSSSDGDGGFGCCLGSEDAQLTMEEVFANGEPCSQAWRVM